MARTDDWQRRYRPENYRPCDRFPEFADREYIPENLEAKKAQWEKELRNPSVVMQFAAAVNYAKYHEKFYRYREHGGQLHHQTAWHASQFKLFSIVKAYDITNKQAVLIALTGFVIAEAGGFGVVKIGFQIVESANDWTILFNKPMAVKIIYPHQGTSVDIKATAQRWHVMYEKALIAHNTLSSGDIEKQYLTMPLLFSNDFGYFTEEYLFPCDQDGYILPSEVNFIQRVKICISLIKAVQKLHARGYVHLDLKPENILLSVNRKGEFDAEVIDLDLAKNIGQVIERRVGTPPYHPPEFIPRNRREKDFRRMSAQTSMDVFTLGIILAGTFIGYADELGESESNGIILSRHIRLQQNQAWTTALPNTRNLTYHAQLAEPLLGSHLDRKASQDIRGPLFAKINTMMQSIPSLRPPLSEVLATFEQTLQQLLGVPFHIEWKNYIAPPPIADKLQIEKQLVSRSTQAPGIAASSLHLGSSGSSSSSSLKRSPSLTSVEMREAIEEFEAQYQGCFGRLAGWRQRRKERRRERHSSERRASMPTDGSSVALAPMGSSAYSSQVPPNPYAWD